MHNFHHRLTIKYFESLLVEKLLSSKSSYPYKVNQYGFLIMGLSNYSESSFFIATFVITAKTVIASIRSAQKSRIVHF